MSIKTLIIEDDFRIANIHKEMVEQLPFCHVVHTALNASEAIDFLSSATDLPDIILLDMYIPDVDRIEFLELLRKQYPYCNIIIASAAKDHQTVKAAKLLGVYDYLIKPIDKNRLQKSFRKFHEEMIFDKEEWNQEDLDKLFHMKNSNRKNLSNKGSELPKGIDELTLEKVKATLSTFNQNYITAQLLAKEVGISRSTARRYLEYLDAEKLVEATVHYGQVGRPQRIYILHEQNKQN